MSQENKLKKGLSYISERTDQLRYSDKLQNEQWLHPLSICYALEEIKRGQPVSIATSVDLDSYGITDTTNTTHTYIVKTNPSKHKSSIGLAMEYGIKGSSIHILKVGKFAFDSSYFNKIGKNENRDNFEKTYEFLKDPKNLGKLVFVKGSTAGELTVNPEEAYLSDNQIIQIGFVSKTSTNCDDSEIELQLEGDSRGPLDHTQFEKIVAEPKLNLDNGPLVFALGQEDDEKFKFKLGYKKLEKFEGLDNYFIALRANNGKVAFIKINNSTNPLDLTYNETDYAQPDLAFLQSSVGYTVTTHQLTVSSDSTLKDDWKGLKDVLNNALKDIAYDEFTLKSVPELLANDKNYIKQSNFIIENEHSNELTNVFANFEANVVGGPFEIFVSSKLKQNFIIMSLLSSGSYFNRGFAVLADITNAKRQNILGLLSGTSATINKPSTFTHLGLVDLKKPLDNNIKVGDTLYLSSIGTITTIPQTYYNSVVKIGQLTDNNTIFVSCDDSRQFFTGDLPIGYIKPAVNGGSEFGFILMDGSTDYRKKDYPELYDFLASVDGILSEDPDTNTFKIKKVGYTFNESNSIEGIAQIKAIPSSVYLNGGPHPFLVKNLDDTEKAEWKSSGSFDIDITKIVSGYGILNNSISLPTETDITLRLFADLGTESNHDWTEILPGFHAFNNTEYYGYEWKIKTLPVSENSPYGRWIVNISKNTFKDGVDEGAKKISGNGFMYMTTPFTPPIDINDKPIKVIIAKHDLWEKQFDIEAILKSTVEQTVLDAGKTPTLSAVSGKAVFDYINKSVKTNILEVKDTKDPKAIATLSLSGDQYNNSISVGNLKEEFVDGTNEVSYKIGLIANGDIVLKPFTNTANNKVFNIFSEDGKLKYGKYYKGSFSKLKKEEASDLYNAIKSDPFHLAPISAINTAVADAIDAKEKTINANLLRGVAPGSPLGEYEYGNKVTNTFIPFAQRPTSTADYQMSLGNKFSYYAKNKDESYDLLASSILTKKVEEYTPSRSIYLEDLKNITPGILSPNDAKYHKVVLYTTALGEPKKFITEYDFNKENIKVYFNNKKIFSTEQTPSEKASIPSTLVVKKIDNEFLPNTQIISNNNMTQEPLFLSTEEFLQNKNFDIATHLNSNASSLSLEDAPKLLSILPTAKYSYIEEGEDKKHWLGIITQRLTALAESLKTTDIKISNKITFGSEESTSTEYIFTDEEKTAMGIYLDMLTGNGDNSQNIASSVGILLQSAKDFQNRLLKLEAASLGTDSSTIPGISKSYTATTNDDTPILSTPHQIGINRLANAIVHELYEEELPNIQDNTIKLPQSKVQKILNEISSNNTTLLNTNVGTYYPKEFIKPLSRESSYTKENIDPIEISYFDKNSIKFREQPPLFKGESSPTEDQKLRSISGKSAGNFTDINDSINRITNKLDLLTSEINGSKNIFDGPVRLNIIRENIETILKEVFYDEESSYYKDDYNTNPLSQPTTYEKSKLSRIDALFKKLSEFTFNELQESDYENIKDKQFNGKQLNVTKQEAVIGSTLSIASLVPETNDAMLKQASITDIIIDFLVGTDTNNLLISKTEENNRKKALISRLASIDESFDMYTKHLSGNPQYETDIDNSPELKKNLWDHIDSIFGFNSILRQILGLEYDSKGKFWKYSTPTGFSPIGTTDNLLNKIINEAGNLEKIQSDISTMQAQIKEIQEKLEIKS